MSAVSLSNQEWTKQNFDDFIVPKYISAPYTTIQNRAQVLDSTNMLQASMGVERVHFKGINLLQKEFGANGESVYELESKDTRIRFVGSWFTINDTNGPGIKTITSNDYIEISFWGTGINLLSNQNGTLYDIRASVDGGVEGGNLFVAGSSVSNGRNYAFNQIVQVVSGLSLNQHTIKLRWNSGSTSMQIYGIEILNQSSNISINPGSAFIGNKKETLAVLSTSAYNAGVMGTKGARVVKYLKDGAISQVVTECAASPSYLTSTNHADEEVVRKINFREFGANRSDDFSTLTTVRISSFTLDDGVTTLVASTARQQTALSELCFETAAPGHVTLTFIGTGLDILIAEDVALANSTELFVDGVSRGYLASSIGNKLKRMTLCSGLPYGTHVIRLSRPSPTNAVGISDFIIYQPKKPSIPNGAVEVADYNVMADYVASTSTTSAFVAQGVMRKVGAREMLYSGTWAISQDSTFINYNNIVTSTVGGYVEYYFFGTGFEHRSYSNNAQAFNQTYSVNGVTNLSGYTTGLIATSTGLSFNASTGVISGTASGSGLFTLKVSGLPLGFHKIKILQNVATSGLYVDAFDIITPIHINHPTLKIGNLSLMDNSKIGAIKNSVNNLPDLSKAKAWVVYDQVNNKILASYNVNQVLNVGTGTSFIYFNKPFKSPNYAAVSSAASYQTTVSNLSQNSCRVFLTDGSSAPNNSTFQLVCFGELQDE